MTFDFYLMVKFMKTVALHVHYPTRLYGTVVSALNTTRILPDIYQIFTRYLPDIYQIFTPLFLCLQNL
jgi:hypothetical protein